MTEASSKISNSIQPCVKLECAFVKDHPVFPALPLTFDIPRDTPTLTFRKRIREFLLESFPKDIFTRDFHENYVQLYDGGAFHTTPTAQDCQSRLTPVDLDATVGDIFERNDPPPRFHGFIIVSYGIVPGYHKRIREPDSLGEGGRAAKKQKREMSILDRDWEDALTQGQIAHAPSEPAGHAQYPLRMGRPLARSAPPLSIYHPIFSTFRKLMDSPDIVLTADAYEQAERFVYGCVNTSGAGFGRGDAMIAVEKIIGSMTIVGRQDDGDCTSVMHASLKTQGVGNVGYLVVGEWKRGIGEGGNVVELAACKYVKLWTGDKVAHTRNVCCCPSFILIFVGHFMAVYGGVFADGFIVQPLSDFIDLAGDAFYEERILRICKIFVALGRCIIQLRGFYDELKPSERPLPTRHVPAFRSLPPTVGDDAPRVVEYIDKFVPDGSHAPTERVLYRAKLGGKDVIMKFCTSYHIEAHRLLATHKLAPEVYHHEVLDGGIHVIVMEYVEGLTLYDFIGQSSAPSLSSVLMRVRTAMKLLHKHGWVWGDLREPNIIVPSSYCAYVPAGSRPDREDAVRLVDFDWCGRAGDARYPLGLGLVTIRLAGAEPGGLIMKKHDEYMLDRLRRRSFSKLGETREWKEIYAEAGKVYME